VRRQDKVGLGAVAVVGMTVSILAIASNRD
jgi:hypothetical protein